MPSWTDGTRVLQAEKGTFPEQLSHCYIHLRTLSKEGGNHPFVPKATLWLLFGRQQLKLISWAPSGLSQWSTEGFHFPVAKNSVFQRWRFLGSSAGKEFTCNAGDPSSIPGLGRSAGEEIGYPLQYSWACLVAQLVRNLPAMWEAWVGSLGWKDPLEKGKATHSSILACRIPWMV